MDINHDATNDQRAADAKDELLDQVVNEIKFKDRFMIQIINHENGYRSEPFLSDWDGLRKSLKEAEENDGPKGKDYILLVAVLRDEETIIPQAPLITVDTFMEMGA